MAALLIDTSLAALLLASIYGWGRGLRRWVPLRFWCRAAEQAYTLAGGLGITTALLLGLSLMGLLRPWIGWGLLAGGLALALWHRSEAAADFRAVQSTLRQLWGGPLLARLLMLMAAGFILTNFIADQAPPVEGDTVHQYLLLPRYWAEAGRYVQPPHIWAASLPPNAMLLSTWALLLRSSFPLATLITGWGMSLCAALGVYALARLYFERGASALAAAVFLTMPDAAYLAQSAKVDMAWATFEVLALAAFLHWLDLTGLNLRLRQKAALTGGSANPDAWLILAGACLGLAAATKSQAFISVTLMGGWLLMRSLLRGGPAAALKAGLTFGGALLLMAFPYLLINTLMHLSPFYPVFADVFVPLGGRPSPRSELGTEVFYAWNLGGYLSNLWAASLGHRPDLGFYLGFIAGPLYLLSLPAGLVMGFYRRRPEVGRLIGWAFAFSLLWFVVKQAVRHFLPGLMPLAAVTGFVLWQAAEDRRMGAQLFTLSAGLCAAISLVLIWGVLYWNGAYRVALGLENRQQYLAHWHDHVIIDTFPDQATLDALNALPPGSRVLAQHANSSLYVHVDLVSPNWGDRIAYNAITDADVLLGSLRQHNIGYILIYKTDQSLPPLFASREFVGNHARLIYDGERTQLYILEGN